MGFGVILVQTDLGIKKKKKCKLLLKPDLVGSVDLRGDGCSRAKRITYEQVGSCHYLPDAQRDLCFKSLFSKLTQPLVFSFSVVVYQNDFKTTSVHNI